ncbi:tRNA (5-methylaminomethyl-2-thiouridine)(34)-methyltransferase MnmD [Flavobacteriaceae bacterium AH-315-B10]|nr:tRNA (5-methylaminomethyl-2-thiouridine)(34)-methyltransferase MnmD [Flavobacteriaceae bacterium AH-315-B10]
MKRKIITTADGSKTIHIEEWDEQYHSKHGAIQEAKHVFIKHGLHHICLAELVSASTKSISILEIGFGTGLNAFITCLEAEKLKLNINYVGVEAYPVSSEEIAELNYAELISKKDSEIFMKLHETQWEVPNQITSNFRLTKRKQFFQEIQDIEQYNIIYFDAFGARVQPELWTEDIFKTMYKALKPNGILVTYSAKGSVRRAMQSVGFTVERLEGPPGKREMLRAKKGAEHSVK